MNPCHSYFQATLSRELGTASRWLRALGSTSVAAEMGAAPLPVLTVRIAPRPRGPNVRPLPITACSGASTQGHGPRLAGKPGGTSCSATPRYHSPLPSGPGAHLGLGPGHWSHLGLWLPAVQPRDVGKILPYVAKRRHGHCGKPRESAGHSRNKARDLRGAARRCGSVHLRVCRDRSAAQHAHWHTLVLHRRAPWTSPRES